MIVRRWLPLAIVWLAALAAAMARRRLRSAITPPSCASRAVAAPAGSTLLNRPTAIASAAVSATLRSSR